MRRCSSAMSSQRRRETASLRGSTPGSTARSGTTRSRSGSTDAMDSTWSACSAGHPNWMLDSDRDGPLPHWRALERAMQRWHFSAHRHVPRRLRRDDGARVLCARPLERPAARRRPVSRRCAAPGPSRRRPRGELGPHGRQGSDLAVLRPVHRPEPGHGRRPAPLSRHRPRAGTRDGMASDRHLQALSSARRLRGSPPAIRARPGPAARALHGQYADERSVRGPLRRAPAVLVGRVRARALPAPLSSASARPRVARALRRGRAGDPACYVQEPSYTDLEELTVLLQHGDAVVCNAGTILLDALVNERPVVCVLYDEGAPPGESWAAKNVVGEHYRELAGSGRLLHGRELRRGGRGHRAGARTTPASSPMRAVGQSARSSVRSTEGPPSGSWTRSKKSQEADEQARGF